MGRLRYPCPRCEKESFFKRNDTQDQNVDIYKCYECGYEQLRIDQKKIHELYFKEALTIDEKSNFNFYVCLNMLSKASINKAMIVSGWQDGHYMIVALDGPDDDQPIVMVGPTVEEATWNFLKVICDNFRKDSSRSESEDEPPQVNG